MTVVLLRTLDTDLYDKGTSFVCQHKQTRRERRWEREHNIKDGSEMVGRWSVGRQSRGGDL